MNIVAAILPILMGISILSALTALAFLQSRAIGLARVLMCSAIVP
jgi:hypothetical protein